MATNPGTPNPYAGGPPPKSGSSGMKIVLIILGIVVLLPMCCCGGCFGFIWIIGDQSPAKNLALEAMNSNDACVEELGTPIEVTLGSMNYNTELNESTAQFPVSGPRGTADVDCRAEKRGGEWVLTSAIVTFSDGTQIDLLEEPTEEPEPDFELRLEEDPDEIPLDGDASAESSDDADSSDARPSNGVRN